ncbi:MAG: Lytic transglycosylase, catalytic [Novosphingobium sp.]|nr:Lytic transglycosylase, catalytic [Novosphingobium sp.]
MSRNSKSFAARWHGIGRRAAVLVLSGLPLIASAPAAVEQGGPAAVVVSEQRFATHIAEASQRFGIPAAWIRAVLDAESAHDTGAVSSAGAMGLMQIMPDTWAELRIQHRLGEDPYDPRDNILAGTAYLRQMLDRYGSVSAMLAAYNAGPGRYHEYVATGRPLPAETRAYVAKLAPILGGEPLPQRTDTTTPRPTDWREAPLFVGPVGGTSPAGPLQSGGQSDAESTAKPRHSDADLSPAPEGIFVVRSSAGSYL